MEVILRPALSSDTDFARTTHHQTYYDVCCAQFGPWNEAAQDRYFQNDWDSTAHEIVLCNGVPCGYICVEDREQDIHVRELVIHSDYQNQGIGSALIGQVMQRAQEREIPIVLGTFLKNRALHLYQKSCFSEFYRTDIHILLRRTPPNF